MNKDQRSYVRRLVENDLARVKRVHKENHWRVNSARAEVDALEAEVRLREPIRTQGPCGKAAFAAAEKYLKDQNEKLQRKLEAARTNLSLQLKAKESREANIVSLEAVLREVRAMLTRQARAEARQAKKQ